MKRTNQMSVGRTRLVIATAAAFVVGGAADAIAASANWNAAPTNGNWITTAGENNWSSGDGTFPGSITTPNSADQATFNVDSSVSTIAINSTAGYTGPLYLANIAFTGATLTTNYTIGSTTGNPIVVTSNANQGSTTFQSFLSGFGRSGATVAVTETVNAPIVIPPQASAVDGFYAFQNNSAIVGDTLRFNGAVSGGTTTGSITLTLRGQSNSIGNVVNGNISNGGAATFNVFKNDGGTWTLAGNNTYNGQTNVSAGTLILSGTNTFNPAAASNNPLIVSGGATLSVSNIANNLGGLTRINLGGGGNTGRLRYTGPGETSGFIIGSNAFNPGFGVIVDQSGTGLLRLTSNLSQSFTAQTVLFQGSTAAAGEFAGQLTDGGSTVALSIAKSGTGRWVLSNATNAYNGSTTIAGGTLEVASVANGGVASNIGLSSNAATNLVLNGGTLRYTGVDTATDRLVGIGTGGGAIDSSGTGAITFNNTGANVALDAPTTATFGSGATTVFLPAGTIGGVVVGQSIAGAGLPAGATITGVNYANNSVTISAAATAAGAAGTPITVSGAVPTRTLTLTGTNTGSNSIAGSIANAATGGVVAVAKTGTGTWTLSGSNTYTGATSVTGGRLVVTAPAQGPLLNGAGGVDLGNGSGTLVLDYTGGSSPLATVKSILTSEYTTATAGMTQPFLTGQIRSTTISTGRRIGYADNGSAITLRVTLGGDADLDGGVSINDFNALAGNFGKSGKVWSDGDFDYDGGVSINDFNLLAASFGQTLPASSEMWAGLLAFAAAHNDLAAFEAVTGVPEPGVLGVLGVGTLLGLRRRRAR